MADTFQAAKLLELIEAAEAVPVQTGSYSDSQIDTVLLAGGPRPGAVESQVRASLINDRIRTCPSCRTVLDLPAPKEGRPTETWRCESCHSGFVTGSTDGDEAAVTRGAQRAFQDTRINVQRLPVAKPGALKDLVSKLSAGVYGGPERRGYPRYSASLPAIGVPLDTSHRVAGAPYRITTRDVSGSGLSGFTEERPPTDSMLIDFTPAGLYGWQAVVRIDRRRSAGFLYEFGGPFLVD